MTALTLAPPRLQIAQGLSPVRIVIALLLWGIFAIKASPLIALGLGLGLLLMHVSSAEHKRLDTTALLILANIGYWLLSGFLCGALTLSMLAQPSYFANEGRLFLAYLPFLILSCCAINRDSLQFTIRQMYLMAMVCVPLFLLWAVASPALISVGRGHSFAGFISSHTGAGTFFSELAVFLILYGQNAGARRASQLGYFMLLPVLGSGSRESQVALIAVLLWYLRRRLTFRTTVSGVALLAVVVSAMPYVAPHTYERSAQMVSPSTFRAIEAQVIANGVRNWEPGQDKQLAADEAFNILSRIIYWNYALRRFQDSPYIGEGFGRFNDSHVHYEGVKGVWYVGTEAQNSPATLQAHNSYLMMACETGLVGLLLLLSVWIMLWRRMGSAQREYHDDPMVRGYCVAMQGLIVFVLVGANFGHALGAPIDAIPLMTLLGVGAAYLRGRRQAQQVPACAG